MASRNLNDLSPQMQIKAKMFVEMCAERGVRVLIYCTKRTLIEQAKLFRQGRTYIEIKNKMYKLRKRGFGFLSDIIEKVGPQRGSRIVTWAGPGESWHNYAEAFDAAPLEDIDGDGRFDALWDIKKYAEQWEIMHITAEELGLTVGGRWKGRKQDSPHYQLRSGTNPTRIYTPEKLICILENQGILILNNN